MKNLTMKNLTSYSKFDYVVENVDYRPINEGIFTAIKALIGKLVDLFKDTEVLNDNIDSATSRLGTKAQNVSTKNVRNGSTVLVKLKNPDNESITIFSLTKLQDLPDNSGLFQLTGTDNVNFLKSMGIKDNTVLNAIGVIVIVDPVGFVKDKPITMRMYKNVAKNGAPIITESIVVSAISAEELAKEKPKSNTQPAPTPVGSTPTI